MRTAPPQTLSAFRAELEGFFEEAVEPRWRARTLSGVRLDGADYVVWQKRLAGRGWGAPSWPVEHGGPGWTREQRETFQTEAARYGAPQQVAQGLELIGPILMAYGSPDQQRRYLPRIVTGEEWWCQGYSEPGAGSDLAALATRAVRVGDDFVVTGHKTWTSYAGVATHMFCLVRTDGGEGSGTRVSMLLVDMRRPGVTVRPIRTLDGRVHVYDVFLDAVRVPAREIVGDAGRGWTYAKRLLDRERSAAGAEIHRLRVLLDGAGLSAAGASDGDRPLARDPAFRRRLATLRIELDALAALSAGDTGATAKASMVKVLWSELLQRIVELRLDIHANRGEAAPADSDRHVLAMQAALYARAATIYGGSSEIQRNVIARRLLSSG